VPIPEGWAIDADGAATTDPEAIAGAILPMAGHKGYAIALMMDVLSGVLTGSGFGSGVAGPYEADRRSGAGHLFVALHVEAFLAPEAFDARMEELVAEVTSGPRAEGVEEILYPGAPEARNDERQRRHGLELAQRTLLDLERLARETGTPFPFHTV